MCWRHKIAQLAWSSSPHSHSLLFYTSCLGMTSRGQVQRRSRVDFMLYKLVNPKWRPILWMFPHSSSILYSVGILIPPKYVRIWWVWSTHPGFWHIQLPNRYTTTITFTLKVGGQALNCSKPSSLGNQCCFLYTYWGTWPNHANLFSQTIKFKQHEFHWWSKFISSSIVSTAH